jgi:hypothetical protein
MPEYKGAPLSPDRGPGLGCFWIQVVALVVLLLLVGQTSIFLLRLVAADRRGRRAPLASKSKTVGELEDEAQRAARDNEDGGMGESR